MRLSARQKVEGASESSDLQRVISVNLWLGNFGGLSLGSRTSADPSSALNLISR